MNHKTKKTRYRLIPPEYNRIPEGKEALAGRIAAQRERLIEERHQRRENAQLCAEEKQEHSLMPFVATLAESAPVYVAEFVKSKPKTSLLIGAGILVAVPWALRRIGMKRLLHGANAMSPLLMGYLESRYLSKKRK